MSTAAQTLRQPEMASEKRRAPRLGRFSLVLAASLLGLAALPAGPGSLMDLPLGIQVQTVLSGASRFVNDVRLIYQIGQLPAPTVVRAAQPNQDRTASEFQDCSIKSAQLSLPARSPKT